MLETKIIVEQAKKGKVTEEILAQVKGEIVGLLTPIKRKGIDKILEWMENEEFFTTPASTKFHGNYEGGLAIHSLLVYREFDFMLDRYGMGLQDDSRKIAALGHDFCKVGVYKKYEPKRKTEKTKPFMFADGLPLGHGEKSIYVIRGMMELTDNEALLIRWHMGAYDPNYEMNQDLIKKKCPELVLLQNADMVVSSVYNA